MTNSNTVKIPVICMGAESKFLTKKTVQLDKIVSCVLVDAYGVQVKDYVVANEAPIPGLYQRTIYKKGLNESEKVGSLFVDTVTGSYTLKLLDPLHRPAGIDIKLTIQTKEAA
ncbi:hypothetical protein D3C75_543870 [compost metagenome]